MKVAVVHEWLVTWAGSERVLAEILRLFPEADLFVLFDRLPRDQRHHLPKDPVGQSFLQHVPFVEKVYRNLLPLMPSAIESLNLASYDLVLSSSHAVAKGILPRPGQLHLCYCHTPPRYLWDMTDVYFSRSFGGALKKTAAAPLLTVLRQWDTVAAERPDAFMANSKFVARRIAKIYRRRSTVIHPPVGVSRFVPKQTPGGEYFVTLGRLVAYKNVDRIVSAFRGSPHKLFVVGDGPGRGTIQSLVRGAGNIEWEPWISDADWGKLLQKARAFIFMAEEDFGITPIEAQAAGVPVIACARGGVLETVRAKNADAVRGFDGVDWDLASGLFYDEPSSESLRKAISTFVQMEERFDPMASRKNAERFSEQIFRENYSRFVREQWKRHHEKGVTDPESRGESVDSVEHSF